MSDKLNELLADAGKRRYSSDELAFMAAAFRENMFTILHERGTGHWGGSASSAELTTCLYFNRLNVDPKNPRWICPQQGTRICQPLYCACSKRILPNG